jgi:ABC-type multidrug transport system ATPase subunit
MHVALHHIGKRYQKEWIFRGIDGQWNEDSCTAIFGGNGSGKSTLTQIISGFLSSSEGELRWSINDKPIPRDKVYEHVSLCTPVVQLWDDFTLRENIEFFLRFKSLRNHFSAADFMQIIELEKQEHRALKNFSSGMRQRVKLGMAILANTSLLILDEPCSHLDERAVQWFQQLLKMHSVGRTIFVASNKDERETFLCESSLDVAAWKP